MTNTSNDALPFMPSDCYSSVYHLYYYTYNSANNESVQRLYNDTCLRLIHEIDAIKAKLAPATTTVASASSITTAIVLLTLLLIVGSIIVYFFIRRHCKTGGDIRRVRFQPKKSCPCFAIKNAM